MEIWTIELNLDHDFSDTCAYHIDYLENTIKTNLRALDSDFKRDRWVLIELAYSYNEAHDKCEKIHRELCKLHNRPMKGLSFTYEEENPYKKQNLREKDIEIFFQDIADKIKEKFDLDMILVNRKSIDNAKE